MAFDDDEAEFFYEDTVPSIQADLAKAFKGGSKSDAFLNDYPISRSYGGKEIFVIPFETSAGYDYKTIKVIVRSGYYSGGNVDYVVEENEYDEELPKGTKTLDARVEFAVRRVEKILRNYGQELIKVAQFSKGEAVYEKATPINRAVGVIRGYHK